MDQWRLVRLTDEKAGNSSFDNEGKASTPEAGVSALLLVSRQTRKMSLRKNKG